MGIYRFADLTVELKNKYPYTDFQCKDYLSCSNSKVDISVNANDSQIQKELLKTPDLPLGYIESICLYRNLSLQLPMFNAMVMHACVFEVNGQGIALLAPSGVGKTTHMRLWQQVLPELTIINGDKPIVRFLDNAPFAYGTPWSGKENLHCNRKVKLTDLCFIERSDKNSVEALKSEDCAEILLRQLLIPKDKVTALLTLQMADKLLNDCHLWKIKCTPTIEAAECAINKIVR